MRLRRRTRRALAAGGLGAVALGGIVALVVHGPELPTRSAHRGAAANALETLASGPTGVLAHDPAALEQGSRPAEHAFALDAGDLQALGLVPAPPGARAGLEVPAEVRLEQAREAMDRFADRLARLEHQREAALGSGVIDTSALDRAIEATRRRLAIAELAERATRAELAQPAR